MRTLRRGQISINYLNIFLVFFLVGEGGFEKKNHCVVLICKLSIYHFFSRVFARAESVFVGSEYNIGLLQIKKLLRIKKTDPF